MHRAFAAHVLYSYIVKIWGVLKRSNQLRGRLTPRSDAWVLGLQDLKESDQHQCQQVWWERKSPWHESQEWWTLDFLDRKTAASGWLWGFLLLTFFGVFPSQWLEILNSTSQMLSMCRMDFPSHNQCLFVEEKTLQPIRKRWPAKAWNYHKLIKVLFQSVFFDPFCRLIYVQFITKQVWVLFLCLFGLLNAIWRVTALT